MHGMPSQDKNKYVCEERTEPYSVFVKVAKPYRGPLKKGSQKNYSGSSSFPRNQKIHSQTLKLEYEGAPSSTLTSNPGRNSMAADVDLATQSRASSGRASSARPPQTPDSDPAENFPAAFFQRLSAEVHNNASLKLAQQNHEELPTHRANIPSHPAISAGNSSAAHGSARRSDASPLGSARRIQASPTIGNSPHGHASSPRGLARPVAFTADGSPIFSEVVEARNPATGRMYKPAMRTRIVAPNYPLTLDNPYAPAFSPLHAHPPSKPAYRAPRIQSSKSPARNQSRKKPSKEAEDAHMKNVLERYKILPFSMCRAANGDYMFVKPTKAVTNSVVAKMLKQQTVNENAGHSLHS